jgi:hypothetical protein
MYKVDKGPLFQKRKAIRCLEPVDETSGQMAGRKERCQTRAALFVHTKTPLYAYARSSLHLRPAIGRTGGGRKVTCRFSRDRGRSSTGALVSGAVSDFSGLLSTLGAPETVEPRETDDTRCWMQ